MYNADPEVRYEEKRKYLSYFGRGLNAFPEIPERHLDVRVLDLNGCHISEIPASIRRLTKLETIYLGGNELTSLPPEIGELRALECLCIDRNRLKHLPPEIGRLENLTRLWADHNLISHLPSELAPLVRAGLFLDVTENPLAEPLPDILSRGGDALADYLAALADANSLYEAKLMLVGEGNVGKSSLAMALAGEAFVEGRATTHGIEIHELRMPHPKEQVEMTVHVWDFGGQEVYRVTHQFFFSPRALYAVVWNSREGQENNDVEGWLRRIRLRVGTNASAIIVATHADERQAELNYPRLQRMFPGMLKGHFAIDSATGTGIAQLFDAISALVADLPQMGQTLSSRWIETRSDVLNRAAEDPQISYDEFVKIAKHHDVDQESEVHTLATLMHDLGDVVYYGDDDSLREILVLNPEWLTKAIGYVLEDGVTRQAGGILNHHRLSEVWGQRGQSRGYPPKEYPYFLRLMERFDVSYRLESDADRSLVAQLVPYERPTLPWNPAERPTAGTRTLRLGCALNDVAPGLVSWLTVRHHDASVGLHWRDGVFLRHPIPGYASEAVLELTDPQTLAIEVRAPSPDLYFGVLRDSVEHLLRRRWPGLAYQLFVPCPGPVNSGFCEARLPLDGLLRRRETGATVQNCLHCDAEHDITELLTGFAAPRATLNAELSRISEAISEVANGLERVEVIAASSAESLRRVTKALATEVLDCPRLFSLSAPSGWRGRFGLAGYSITLWCEHPGYWHPVDDASYSAGVGPDWLLPLLPYAKYLLNALRMVVPVAGAAAAVGMSVKDFERASAKLDAMAHVVDALSELDQKVEKATYDVLRAKEEQQVGRLNVAEGEGLRALRTFLFRTDESRRFGDLRRAQTPAGDFVWVCHQHYRDYDPGLPRVPTTGRGLTTTA